MELLWRKPSVNRLLIIVVVVVFVMINIYLNLVPKAREKALGTRLDKYDDDVMVMIILMTMMMMMMLMTMRHDLHASLIGQ